MKKDIHPKNYRKVIFVDASSDERFLIGSTVDTNDTGTWDDGKEYPLVSTEVSSASHPFYTGKETMMDTTGRVDKFRRRQSAAKPKA